jgi:predicted nucleic acid-binding protein
VIVVDANIISYSLIEGDRTDSVLLAREKDPHWIVPSLWKHEFLNVLSTLTKNKLLHRDQSIEIWKTAHRTFSRNEYPIDYVDTFDISIRNKVSSYDAQYISLAQTMKTICLTEDKKLLSKFPEVALSSSQFIIKGPQ